MKRLSLLVVAGLMAAATPSLAQDQAWPKRAVSVVVPFAAGGTTDMFGRIFTNDMQAKYGQPFVVENKPGAGGTIGSNDRRERPTRTASYAARRHRQHARHRSLTSTSPLGL